MLKMQLPMATMERMVRTEKNTFMMAMVVDVGVNQMMYQNQMKP